MDSGAVLEGLDSSGLRFNWLAGSRGAASRGRMSVDLAALGCEARMRQLCPNLVKCEEEQLAAIARNQQHQQKQQQE
jgi:hypothetical protein